MRMLQNPCYDEYWLFRFYFWYSRFLRVGDLLAITPSVWLISHCQHTHILFEVCLLTLLPVNQIKLFQTYVWKMMHFLLAAGVDPRISIERDAIVFLVRCSSTWIGVLPTTSLSFIMWGRSRFSCDTAQFHDEVLVHCRCFSHCTLVTYEMYLLRVVANIEPNLIQKTCKVLWSFLTIYSWEVTLCLISYVKFTAEIL